MKNYFILFLSLFFLKSTFSQTDLCKDSNGYYFYYAALNIDTVYNSFTKQDFINHMIDSSNVSNIDSTFLYGVIAIVDKSFPTAINDTLQRTVSVHCNTDTLENYLNSFNNSFNLVEYFCWNYQLTSIKENNDETKLTVYPNPLSQNSIIKISNINSYTQLKLIDTNGRIIKMINTNNDIIINLSDYNLTKGIYYVQLKTNNNYQTIRVIK